MPTLEQLMSLPGVYGAIEFSCKGELGEMRGEIDQEFAELVAQMCAANVAIYECRLQGGANIQASRVFCRSVVLLS